MKGEIQVLMTELREVTFLWTRCPCEKDNKQTKKSFLLQAGLVLSHCQALLRCHLFPEAFPLLCKSIRYDLFNFQI